jgi:peptide/nickel transport system substrate-binding protein
MKTAKRLIALLLALCLVFAMVACSSSDDTTTTDTTTTTDAATTDGTSATTTDGTTDATTTDASATTLVIGDVNAPNTFDVTNRYYAHWETMVFDTLVASTPEGDIEPCIATDWNYTDDTTLVLNLRDDVFCTNGEQITASDCLWSLKFWATETAQASSMTAFDLDNSYAEDDYTLVLKFTMAYGPGVNSLSNFYMWDEEWASNATGDDWWGAPNGSGPYTLVENVDGAYCSFQRKDDYWGELPEVTFVTYKYYSEPTTMFIDLENGAIDLAVDIQASDAERVLANPDDYSNLTYESRELVDNMNLFLCDYVEYFQDVNVREAICLALNNDEIATGMYGSLFKHATSVMPSGIQYYIPCNIPEQDLDRAKELMAASAWPDGFELRLVVTTGQDLAATVIQEQLAKIGITVNVETYDPGTAVPMMQAGEVDLSLRVGMGGASYRDPFMGISDVFAYGSTMRATMQNDDEFNEHFDAGLYSVDPEVRQENYEWMQNWLVDNYHVYPICERCVFIAWDSSKIESCSSPIASYVGAQWIKLAK